MRDRRRLEMISHPKTNKYHECENIEKEETETITTSQLRRLNEEKDRTDIGEFV